MITEGVVRVRGPALTQRPRSTGVTLPTWRPAATRVPVTRLRTVVAQPPSKSAAGGRTGLLLTLATVAASTRAGSPVSGAWVQAGVPVDGHGLPAFEALTDCARVDIRSRRKDQSERLVRQQAAAVSGACRVAAELGTPLADVLDEVGKSVRAHRSAQDDRRSALAGPRASAQVLAWLPVATVGLGALLGAEPWQIMLGGGLGTTCLIAGAALLWAGRRWTRALLNRAERAEI